jgi:hypothetical protein
LAFSAGEQIVLLERVSAEWLRGQCRGQTGLFPSAFVEIIEDLPPQGKFNVPAVFCGMIIKGLSGEIFKPFRGDIKQCF